MVFPDLSDLPDLPDLWLFVDDESLVALDCDESVESFCRALSSMSSNLLELPSLLLVEELDRGG